MMDKQTLPFLGRGWSFPPQFSANGEQVEMTSGVENVHKCVEILLHTGLGERTMQEEFGGSLNRFLFEPLSARLIIDIKEHISSAIVDNEPRVILEGVDIVEDRLMEGLLLIQLQYTIRGKNSRYNMVYPFYLYEANAQP